MTDTAEPRLRNVAQCVACDRPPGEHRHLRRRMRMPELLDDHQTAGLVAAMNVEQHDGQEPLCERGLEDLADIGEQRFVADRSDDGRVWQKEYSTYMTSVKPEQ